MTIREAYKRKGNQILPKTRLELARRIDETRLTFTPSEDENAVIRAICENALVEQFRAVCVRPRHVALAKSILEGSSVLVATVIGFPLKKEPLEEQRRNPTIGNIPWEDKVAEMKQAIIDGADEFDIVMNTTIFTSASPSTTNSPETYEVAKLVEHSDDMPIKLIIETDLLGDEEIAKATQMAITTGIEYVKTSTGMLDGGLGATVHNVSLIHKTIEESPVTAKPGIKASGGVRTATQAMEVIQAGADILGSSSGSALLDDFEQKNHIEFNL